MQSKHVIVCLASGKEVDVVIPSHISADALVHALHTALQPNRPCPAYIRSENPIALIQGPDPIAFFCLRDGSKLYMA